MINCTVKEDRIGNLIVTFSDEKDIYLQTESDKANFFVNCGVVKAPENWDGCPSNLPDEWWMVDCEDITECLDEYYDLVE